MDLNVTGAAPHGGWAAALLRRAPAFFAGPPPAPVSSTLSVSPFVPAAVVVVLAAVVAAVPRQLRARNSLLSLLPAFSPLPDVLVLPVVTVSRVGGVGVGVLLARVLAAAAATLGGRSGVAAAAVGEEVCRVPGRVGKKSAGLVAGYRPAELFLRRRHRPLLLPLRLEPPPVRVVGAVGRVARPEGRVGEGVETPALSLVGRRPHRHRGRGPGGPVGSRRRVFPAVRRPPEVDDEGRVLLAVALVPQRGLEGVRPLGSGSLQLLLGVGVGVGRNPEGNHLRDGADSPVVVAAAVPPGVVAVPLGPVSLPLLLPLAPSAQTLGPRGSWGSLLVVVVVVVMVLLVAVVVIVVVVGFRGFPRHGQSLGSHPAVDELLLAERVGPLGDAHQVHPAALLLLLLLLRPPPRPGPLRLPRVAAPLRPAPLAVVVAHQAGHDAHHDAQPPDGAEDDQVQQLDVALEPLHRVDGHLLAPVLGRRRARVGEVEVVALPDPDRRLAQPVLQRQQVAAAVEGVPGDVHLRQLLQVLEELGGDDPHPVPPQRQGEEADERLEGRDVQLLDQVEAQVELAERLQGAEEAEEVAHLQRIVGQAQGGEVAEELEGLVVDGGEVVVAEVENSQTVHAVKGLLVQVVQLVVVQVYLKKTECSCGRRL